VLARFRTSLSESLAWTDDVAQRLSLAALTWLVWPALYAIGLGAGLWAASKPARLATLDTNKLPEPERIGMVKWVVGAVVALAALYLAVMVIERLRTRHWEPIRVTATLNRWLSPLLAIPVVAYLRLPNIEKDSPKLTLFLVTLVGIAVARAVYGFPERLVWPRSALADSGSDVSQRSVREQLEGVAPFLAAFALVVLWAGYGYFFARLSITNHHGLGTRTTDLGYYDNIFYQSVHGRPLACTFIKAGYHGSAHFDPILVLLSPLYLLYPRAEMLLVLQSVWLGAGVVPVYLLTVAKLRSRVAGLLLAVAWVLYPAMQGANMYEFHSLTLISPLLAWALYLLEIGAVGWYYGVLSLLLLCREDVALLMCFVGLYAILMKRPWGPRVGWATIASSLVYFAIVKIFFMTSAGIFMTGADAYSFAYYYEALIPNRTGLGGLLISLVTNPVFALRTALDEPKVLFLITLFLPLFFLPMLAKTGRLMLVYGLLFCLLASRGAVFSIHFQYSAVIFPIAFALTPIALEQIADGRGAGSLGLDGKRLARALLGAAFVASVLVSWKFGGMFENAVFKGGFARVIRNLTDDQRATYNWVKESTAQIPKRASVSTTNKLGPHVSNRRYVYFWPNKNHTDYVFVDESELKGNDLERHNGAKSRNEIVEVSRKGTMALYKRQANQPAPPPTPTPDDQAVPPSPE